MPEEKEVKKTARKLYYTNKQQGVFFDGKHKIYPNTYAEVDEGSETPKMLKAWKGDWLEKTQDTPEKVRPCVPKLVKKVTAPKGNTPTK